MATWCGGQVRSAGHHELVCGRRCSGYLSADAAGGSKLSKSCRRPSKVVCRARACASLADVTGKGAITAAPPRTHTASWPLSHAARADGDPTLVRTQQEWMCACPRRREREEERVADDCPHHSLAALEWASDPPLPSPHPPHKCRRLTIIPQRAQHPVTSAHMRSKQLLSLKAPSLHHA